MEKSGDKYKSFFDVLKRLGTLYVENVRLTTAEKLTMLMTGIAVFSIIGVLSVLALVFIAIGLASVLEVYIAPFWSYFIIAAIFIIAAFVLATFRTVLIADPIARFISKIFLNPPKSDRK